ncbi:MAG: aminopeptidase [Chloroflexota bacterium]
MVDIRLKRLADVLVNYSTEVQPGQWVGILGDVTTLPALREIYAAVVKAGGYPQLKMSDDWMYRHLLRHGTDAQLEWLDPAETKYYEEADVYIRVGKPGSMQNTRAMTNIPGKRVQKYALAHQSWLNTRLDRAARGEFRWVGTWFPTEAGAQEANRSLEEYEDFVYGAMFCYLEDPVAEWKKLSAMQQEKIDWLKGKKQFTLKGPNVDLTLSVEGRRFINSDGHANMPSGEIFTGPVEESVNGWVRYTYPTIVGGRAISGIELKFVDGRVEEATAAENAELLLEVLDTDPGARYLGEFAIGTNFGINQFTGNILFDEKIGGTFHAAVGRSYKETGGVNESAVHWDMICDLREDSEIHVDGELFYRNGEFVV